MRLPTEAEWDLVAGGTEKRPNPWGDVDARPSCDGVVFGRGPGQECANRARPGEGPDDVGTAKQDKTKGGVRDLAGSVAEWVYDQYVKHPDFGAEPITDPVVEKVLPLERDYRVVRGGAWDWPEQPLVTALRRRVWRGDARSDIGFRCVRSQGKELHRVALEDKGECDPAKPGCVDLEAAVFGADKPAATPRTYGGGYVSFTPPRGWALRPTRTMAQSDSVMLTYEAPRLPVLFDAYRPFPLEVSLAAFTDSITAMTLQHVPGAFDVKQAKPEPYKNVAPGLRAYHAIATYKKKYTEPVHATLDGQVECYAIEYRELAHAFCSDTLRAADGIQSRVDQLMRDTVSAMRPAIPDEPIAGAHVVYGGNITITVPARWQRTYGHGAMAPLKIAPDASDLPPVVVEFWPVARGVEKMSAKEFLDSFAKQLVFADLDKPALFPGKPYKDGDTEFADVKFEWRDLRPGQHHGYCKAALHAGLGQMVCFKAFTDESLLQNWVDGRAILDSMRAVKSDEQVVHSPLEEPPPPSVPANKEHA
jgi:hypothetical protein